ncbi:(-)-trans-carveol dehydrogenase [Gossypium arboreum]|uniref:(-)-trans-carveol dehydrogenase n=1 Tax=Gossypium arboreum TaxID=29729 RepID=A0A0B0MXQ2_GOSAR|nr:(-)-trans-carveol dehydrogenase [Gossypium arboreum]
MEEGDKSTGIGGEISTRVSAGSTSWLFASRQRFTIELRPGETTIVSWKRLIKDAQDTSPHLTAPNTEDSLDECCRDDKSTSKQNGLLVKFDKLECTNETVLSVAQPSRKRSKNMAEAQGEKDGDHEPRVSNKDVSISPSNSEDVDKYRRVTVHSNNLENNTDSLATNQKYVEKKPCKKLESPVRKLMIENDVEGISTKVEQREETCGELPDLNLPVYPVQSEKSLSLQSKDVSNLRTKGIMLERAMRELEKVVAESRLSTMEVQDIDASSTTIKRRLPCEVKQKLAKVARLAHSSQGKISKELINKLMNILGHSVQLRTLKRNLKEMILMGISAKQEKAYRFEQIKLEVIEMIKSQASMLGDVPTGDIQEVLGYEEKVALKKQYSMDNVIEDKICDLYDLYTQGIDEDKGTQIRKLYVELAELWPNGIMDKHGIKSAICRAKERRRALCEHDKILHKELTTSCGSISFLLIPAYLSPVENFIGKSTMEAYVLGVRLHFATSTKKMSNLVLVRENRRKKSAQKTKTGVVKACSVSQLQAEQENQASASSGHVLALPCMTIYCKETLDQHLAAPLESCSVPPNSSLDISEKEKNEKMTIPMLKKQMKHKNRVKKLSMKLEKGSHKSHKQAIKHPDGVSHELAGPPSCGHPV